MCKEEGEDMNHFLLDCGFTMSLWWDMFKWFGTPWTVKNCKRVDVQLEEPQKNEKTKVLELGCT